MAGGYFHPRWRKKRIEVLLYDICDLPGGHVENSPSSCIRLHIATWRAAQQSLGICDLIYQRAARSTSPL